MTKTSTISPVSVDPNDPRPFQVREAAQLATVGSNQLYAAIARGEVPHFRIGKRILIPRKAFLELLASGSIDAA